MADTDTAAGVKSARRAVELLEAFGADHAWLSLTDLHRHTGIPRSALFAPDGNTLTTSDDGTVRLWDTDAFNDLATLTDNACTVAGRSLTEQEWRRYVPDGVAYRRICP